MGEVAIIVEGLGKRYRIGATRAPYRTLRETIVDVAASPARRVTAVLRGQAASTRSSHIWALRDVTFDVRQGEAVGIIGRNGAGKSTLLKLLSRITKPTEGRARVFGRVGSLLEVGTGFHPELTGRENIYLNGAILGMRRAEILRKFDEIVAFAEIEQFLDTPVKHYSSGMYVRLAFAVAAHLEPEILIVDEVLAVGDSAFQRKCLGKMKDVAEGGRTVFLVSHNLGAISQLSNVCLWLDQGRVVKRGDPHQMIREYLGAFSETTAAQHEISPEKHMHAPLGLSFTRVTVLDENDQPTSRILFGDPLKLECEFQVDRPIRAARLGVAIQGLDGTLISVLHHTDDEDQQILALVAGSHLARISTPIRLMPGGYSVDLFAKPDPGYWGSGDQSLDWVRGATAFDVEGVSRRGRSVLPSAGVILPPSRWSIRPVEPPPHSKSGI